MPACKPKGHQLDSQSGNMPGLQATSPVWDIWEATTHWCFSSSPSSSFPLSKNKIKSLKKVLKNYIGTSAFPWIIIEQNTTLNKSGSIWNLLQEDIRAGTPIGHEASLLTMQFQGGYVATTQHTNFQSMQTFLQVYRAFFILHNSSQFRIEMDGANFNLLLHGQWRW